jgi:hypothetical protein
MSGSIGDGAAASTTKPLSGDGNNTNSNALPVITAVCVGLAVMWWAEKFLGRLHV